MFDKLRKKYFATTRYPWALKFTDTTNSRKSSSLSSQSILRHGRLTMKKTILFLTALAVAALASGSAAAQKKDGQMRCGDSSYDNRLQTFCEIKEQTLAATGAVAVDGKQNGGISIKGWDRADVLVRARVQTAAPTQAEAEALAKQIVIETAGPIHAEGPEQRDDYHWYVSYEIFVPRHTDLSLEAHNGGISIAEVSGKMEFHTTNGGVHLSRVGGNVRGTTTNGGLTIELAGTRWDGEALDVKTTNGGVNLIMPDNYSAHLETATVNGNVSFGFPVNVQPNERGRMPKSINVDLGSGGPTIRATTTNGGVRVGSGKRTIEM
jgi:hypothetical protein